MNDSLKGPVLENVDRPSSFRIAAFMLLLVISALSMCLVGLAAVYMPELLSYTALIRIFCLLGFAILVVTGWYLKLFPKIAFRSDRLVWLLSSISAISLSLVIMSMLAGEYKPALDYNLGMAYSMRSILVMWATSLVLITGIAFYILYRRPLKHEPDPGAVTIMSAPFMLWSAVILVSVLCGLAAVVLISHVHGLMTWEASMNEGRIIRMSVLDLRIIIPLELLVSVSAIFVAELLLLISLIHERMVGWSLAPLLIGYAVYSTVLILGYWQYHRLLFPAG
jgi:hypothetical protein